MNRVAIIKTIPDYPLPPFSPSVRYPEYRFNDINSMENYVYNGIRDLLMSMSLDMENFGTEKWNPLKNIIKPNDVVVIKPNMVNSVHFGNGDLSSVITHASIIRAIIDYVLIALNGTGRIIIADSPERMADFDEILKVSGIKDLIVYYKKYGINVEIRDLRREKIKYGFGAIAERKRLNGDPEGYSLINIGKYSAFYGLPDERLSNLYGADYDRRETLKHHTDDIHEYEISNTILKSDVIISIPKLKTHQKAGITLNLKGFIGCTGNKNLIPHRTLGDPSNDGDSYPYPAKTRRGAFIRWMRDFLKDNILGIVENKYSAIFYSGILGVLTLFLRPPQEDLKYGGGEWYGNDTLWRSVIDVARILFYANKEGRLCTEKQREFICIVDGIYAGDKKGPMEPRTRKEGIIIGGFDPVAVDIVGTQLMGFDYSKVLYLKNALKEHKYNISIDLNNIKIISNEMRFEHLFDLTRNETLCFEPAETWKRKIVLSR